MKGIDYDEYEVEYEDVSYSYLYLNSIEKVQHDSYCLACDHRGDMKHLDGRALHNLYYLDPSLTCSELIDQDYCVFEYIDDDESLSDELLDREEITVLNSEDFL